LVENCKSSIFFFRKHQKLPRNTGKLKYGTGPQQPHIKMSEDDFSEHEEDADIRFERKFSYHSDASEFWIYNQPNDFREGFADDSDSEEGYDIRQDEEKEDQVEELEDTIKCCEDDLFSLNPHGQFLTEQIEAHNQFVDAEIRNTNAKGKVLSYSKSNLNYFTVERCYMLDSHAIPSETDVLIAGKIREHLAENGRIFMGDSEMRRRIDIDSIVRCVFCQYDNVKFEVEGKGATAANGKIDYIVYVDDVRIGIIEAKKDKKDKKKKKKDNFIKENELAELLQLRHEMMAIVKLADDSTTPFYVFGFLTDGANWSLNLSNYDTMLDCGNFTIQNDLEKLVATLRTVVLSLSEICKTIFLDPFVANLEGPLLSELRNAEEELDFISP
jgi:hypothetical protein